MRIPDQKTEPTPRDLDDVTLGPSPWGDYLSESGVSTTGAGGITKIRGFPSPSHDGFGFSLISGKLPTGKLCQLGAVLIHFKRDFHGEPPG